MAIGLAHRENEASVLFDLNNIYQTEPKLQTLDVQNWIDDHNLSIVECRSLIATAAREYSWFKNPDQGKRLAEWVLDHEAELDGSVFWQVVSDLKTAIYPAIETKPSNGSESSADG